jgi:hypothetical protein
MIEDNGRSDKLKDIIYSLHGIDVMERRRPRKVADMRKIYCKILHDEGLTLTHIGQTIGFDHATVIHHNKRFEDLAATEPVFTGQYREIYSEFKKFDHEFEKADAEPMDKRPTYKKLESMVVDYDASEKVLKSKVDGLINEIHSLKQELAELRGEKRELVPIMNLVRERTRKGQEPLIFRKIQALYNG